VRSFLVNQNSKLKTLYVLEVYGLYMTQLVLLDLYV